MCARVSYVFLQSLPITTPGLQSRTRFTTLLRQNGLSGSKSTRALRSGAISPVHCRGFLTEALPPYLVPPTIFTTLLAGLWAYKCFMTIVFQEKFIYMPYMPPFARSERVEDYAEACLPVRWEQIYIKSVDGTRLALVIGSIPQVEKEGRQEDDVDVVICYFQGNGSSSPPRLPLLSHVLRLLHYNKIEHSTNSRVRYTMLALSYRGYWKSSGRASQRGIELDSKALLRWIEKSYSDAVDTKKLHVVLWGQSIGAGVASTAAASLASSPLGQKLTISSLILETPFTSVKSMLFALYPQKWLPYQYLWPFLRNHWDSEQALQTISTYLKKPKILLLAATRDEVVPPEEVDKLERLCTDLDFELERKAVHGALHTEATTRREGQAAVASFIREAVAAQL
nr:protein abhd13 [Quercus suber]